MVLGSRTDKMNEEAARNFRYSDQRKTFENFHYGWNLKPEEMAEMECWIVSCAMGSYVSCSASRHPRLRLLLCETASGWTPQANAE
jgi:hypothetical protein